MQRPPLAPMRWAGLPGPEPLRRAVFLDRDGVLNHNVYYADTGQWEAPRLASAFVPVAGLGPALARLRAAGFLLFVVSNQPNTVNGKSPAGTLAAMHSLLTTALAAAGVSLDGAFYCTHHPSVTGPCACRKPSPYLLFRAAQHYELALPTCWMIGDRVTDMECGRAAGVRTAWIDTGQEATVAAPHLIDSVSTGLREAVEQILAFDREASRALSATGEKRIGAETDCQLGPQADT